MFGLLLLEQVPLGGVGAALDIGCGTGFPLIELAERLGPACQVHGIDPWREALSRAAAKIANRGVANATLHEGGGSQMPFAAATFDLIVSNLGLNNFEDRRAVMRECRRVARPGGVLALTTNLQGHMREFYAVFEQVLTQTDDHAALARLGEHIAHRATIAGVVELLTAGGFAVSRIVEREGSRRFADGTALLNHHFIKLGFLDGWKQVAKGHERETFTRLRDTLDQSAKATGELRLTIPMAYIEATAAPI